MRRKFSSLSPLLAAALSLFSALSSASGATTCPYDIANASTLIPPACYANYTAADTASAPPTNCCWFVFAAYIFSAIHFSNASGTAFLPSPTSSACSNAFASYLVLHRLVRPSLLLTGDRCNLNGDPSQFTAGKRPCQYPTVAAIRSAVDLSPATRLCAVAPRDLLSDQPSCTACQNAVISATLSLLKATASKEFVPCGMATTIGIWSSSPPELHRFRSYALCMVQVLDNVGSLGTTDLVPSPPSPQLPPPLKTRRNKRTLIVAASSSSAAALSAALALALCLLVRRRNSRLNGVTSSVAGDRTTSITHPLPTEGLYIFTKSELKQATNRFHASLLLGEGGAGKVYLGQLPSGQQVAIKRIRQKKKVDEFYREVEILARLRHRNLTTLVGYCSHHKERALVYEYMGGGNLARVLHHGELSWLRRVEIAADVAEGLAYLHDLPEGAVVHRDVKPTNVLLSETGLAKLSDFGVSKVLPSEMTHVSTEVIKGTRGYMDPESYFDGRVSDGSDVYSFGIVLLELLSGRKAVVPTPSGGAESIVYSAHELVVTSAGGDPDMAKIADRRLGPCVDTDSVAEVFKVAYRCVRPFKNERPRMKEVLEVLKGVVAKERVAAGTAELADSEEHPQTEDAGDNISPGYSSSVYLSSG